MVISAVGLLDLGQSNFFPGIVSGADAVCAFERHVLKHVRHSRLASWILGRTRVHDSGEGEDRSLRPLAHNHCQPIFQNFHAGTLLKRSQILGRAAAQQ